MELSQEYIEILDRYFRNELTDEELARLQTEMKNPEFSESVNFYLETLKVIEAAGRNELRLQLLNIQKEVEGTDGYDDYKPSSTGKGPGGGGYIISIIVVIVAVTAYLFYSGKFSTEKLNNIIPDSEKADTVYHYIIQRDTFVVNKNDTEKIKNLHRIESDTVFIRNRVKSDVYRDSSGNLWKEK